MTRTSAAALIAMLAANVASATPTPRPITSVQGRVTTFGDSGLVPARGSLRDYGPIGSDGTFSIRLVGNLPTILCADLDDGLLRTYVFGHESDISPFTEVGVRLTYPYALYSIDGSGFVALVAAIAQANADNDFSSLSLQAALDLAEQTARQSSEVAATLGARITPTPTFRDTSTPTLTYTPTMTATPKQTIAPLPCTGDCDGDGQVTIDEIVQTVNIALGDAGLSSCLAFDLDAPQALVRRAQKAGELSVADVIQTIERALEGCPPQPALPDLMISGAVVSGYACDGGRTVLVCVTNVGQGDAEAATLAYGGARVRLGSTSVGGEQCARFYAVDGSVIIEIDPDDEISEDREGNNVVNLDIFAVPTTIPTCTPRPTPTVVE